MINYLFSGINKEKGFTKEQAKYLKEDIKSDYTITFIASIFDDSKRNDDQLLRFTELFKNIGIIFKKTNIIDNRTTKSTSKKLIKNSDVIFLLGGSPELQMKSILEYNLTQEIKESKIVIGVSAGSMNQSKRVMYRDDFDNFIMKDYPGLGLVEINIFPHIDLDYDKLIIEAKEISQTIPLILLPNDSFIRIANNNIEIVGKHYILDLKENN